MEIWGPGSMLTGLFGSMSTVRYPKGIAFAIIATIHHAASRHTSSLEPTRTIWPTCASRAEEEVPWGFAIPTPNLLGNKSKKSSLDMCPHSNVVVAIEATPPSLRLNLTSPPNT